MYKSYLMRLLALHRIFVGMNQKNTVFPRLPLWLSVCCKVTNSFMNNTLHALVWPLKHGSKKKNKKKKIGSAFYFYLLFFNDQYYSITCKTSDTLKAI